MADAPPSVLRVINASRKLDASSKLLLGEIFRLDRSYKGCYARQTSIARRVGRSVDAMKACRTKLREAGFLERSEERLSGDRRHYTWFFILPECYWPSEHAKDEEIFGLADQLDEALRSGKIREEAEDSRKVLDALKRTAGGGTVVNAFDLELAKAKEREKQVVSTPAIGGVDADNRGCPHPQIGGVDTPPSKRTEKNCLEQISTEGSQSDLHEKNGTTESDPTTKPRTQSPECPHPQSSPRWKSWQRERLQAVGNAGLVGRGLK